MAEQTTTGGKKNAPERLKKPEEMNAEERAKYDAMSPAQRGVYDARLAAQAATDMLAEAKRLEDEARTQARRQRALDAGEKKLVAAVRSGEINLADEANGVNTLRSKIKSLVVTSTGAIAYDVAPPTTVREDLKVTDAEAEAMIPRIQEAAKKAATTSSTPRQTSMPAPSYTLSHSLSSLTREQLLPPTDGGRPDGALAALIQTYGHIMPFTVLPADASGKYPIFDGKRRYHLLKEGESIPAIIISGFPDEGTAELAEIAVNRARSLNVLRAGEIVTRTRTRGKDDAYIRKVTGMRTGEVEKYASASALPPVIVQGIKDGRITSNTALLITKQPQHIKDALAVDFTKRRAEETEKAPARLTEADVEAARSTQSAAAVNRDGAQLSAFTNAVTTEDATGGGGTENP